MKRVNQRQPKSRPQHGGGRTVAASSSVRLPGRLQFWSLARLKPYARNPRTHSPQQINRITASILEYGFTNPILVDREGGIVAGHGRLLAARKLGLERVPVIQLGHLTETQRRAYLLADNRLALDAGWDPEMLLGELRSLEEDAFDLSAVGFDDRELAELEAALREASRPAHVAAARRAGRILYMLEFDTAEQKDGWLGFLGWLRRRHPERSLPGALLEHVQQAMAAPAPARARQALAPGEPREPAHRRRRRSSTAPAASPGEAPAAG